MSHVSKACQWASPQAISSEKHDMRYRFQTYQVVHFSEEKYGNTRNNCKMKSQWLLGAAPSQRLRQRARTSRIERLGEGNSNRSRSTQFTAQVARAYTKNLKANVTPELFVTSLREREEARTKKKLKWQEIAFELPGLNNQQCTTLPLHEKILKSVENTYWAKKRRTLG